MLVCIGNAASVMGVAVSTMRRWDYEGRLRPDCRTLGNQRRYNLISLQRMFRKDDEANTVYASKLYGARSHKNKIVVAETST